MDKTLEQKLENVSDIKEIAAIAVRHARVQSFKLAQSIIRTAPDPLDVLQQLIDQEDE